MQPKANTNTNTEFIPLSEAKRYLSRISPDPPDRYFQHILLGWMTFVAPLTPSSVDAVPHLKCNKEAARPLDTIPESVHKILQEVTSASLDSQLSETKSFSLLSKAWPTMWIWIQHIYHNLVTRRYTLLGAVFNVFVDYDGEPMVAEILASHPGILYMMADMWIKEGTDKNAVHGFHSGNFADPRLVIHQRFLAQVVSVCGSAGEFVHVVCQRIERLLGQARRDYDLLSAELTSLTQYLRKGEGPCIIRPAFYASSRVATTLMHAWAHTTSNSSGKYRDEFLLACVTGIYMLVESSPQAYDRILDILDHDFLSQFTKSVQLMPSSSTYYGNFINIAVAILEEIICPATVHREILYSMQRCVVLHSMQGDSLGLALDANPRIRKPWFQLIKLLDERKERYSMYKKSSRSVLLCGNAECGNGNRGGLLRCSACRISLYCSRKCQREHWARHKPLCNGMKGNIQNCIDLSYPNLHYLSYLVASDTEVWHSAYMASVKARATSPGSVPFFFLNYVKHSDCASNIHLLDANDKKPGFPFSDDDNLYKEWCKALVTSKEQVLSLLVAIPRGTKDAFQMMTSAVVLTDGGAGQHPAIGLRWLHCQ